MHLAHDLRAPSFFSAFFRSRVSAAPSSKVGAWGCLREHQRRPSLSSGPPPRLASPFDSGRVVRRRNRPRRQRQTLRQTRRQRQANSDSDSRNRPSPTAHAGPLRCTTRLHAAVLCRDMIAFFSPRHSTPTNSRSGGRSWLWRRHARTGPRRPHPGSRP